jgi:dTDP-4-dehydrorhamnose 3,5-epimerase
MQITKTPLQGLLIIDPEVFGDERGYFLETHHQNRYRDAGIDRIFVQDNLSFSGKNTLRGLHFQRTRPQAKLVQAVTGEIFDVAVDIRPGSATFGQWSGVHLSERNKRQLFVPEGFAHGFCVLSDSAHIIYKCSDEYVPQDEGGILWSDPAIGIAWPVKNPLLSAKDRRFPCLSALASEKRFSPQKNP